MNFAIAGAGIPGIYAALMLRKKYPLASIHLIEASNEMGGLYSSHCDKVAGVFDKGMHIIYETLDEEIDAVIRGALPDSDWTFLEGNNKDIAGVLYQGELCTKTPYINLNHLDKDALIDCMGEMMQSFNRPLKSTLCYESAYDYFVDRFGVSVSNRVIEPIINKLWKMPAESMHSSSTRLVLMDRIALFNEAVMDDLMKSTRIKEVLAYPDQRNLNLANRSRQRGLYPKRFGLSNLMNGFKQVLKKEGVAVHYESTISRIGISNGKITQVALNSKHIPSVVIENLSHLVWCAPLSPLAQRLGVKLSDRAAYDPPLIQRYVYLLIDKKANMDGIYYYYSFEENTNTFRVTNYEAYCPGSARFIPTLSSKKLYPLCIELHFSSEMLDVSDDFAMDSAISELINAKVIESASDVVFRKVIGIPSGFPLLTKKNSAIFAADRNLILNLELDNLVLSGQVPERGVFFLHETLIKLHEELKYV